MKVILDTHMLLWALSGDERLPDKAKRIIEREDNDIYYSLVSIWEVELKHILHPDLMTTGARKLTEYCRESGFLRLPVSEESIYELHTLVRSPEAKPHKEPFDRLLICQAKTEDMLFITHDSLLAGYDEPCVVTL
jgi:PIN domain nuclease of toxin-antitoxin system